MATINDAIINERTRIVDHIVAAIPPDDMQPIKKYAPITEVDNDDLTLRDMLSFITAAVAQKGPVDHNLSGYNHLIESGLKRILMHHFELNRSIRNERSQTDADKAIKSFNIHVRFHSVDVGRPVCTTYMTGQFTDLYPSQARLTGIPYSGAITLGATTTIRAFFEDGHVEEKEVEIPTFQIGSFPTMVGGVNCHTSNCSRSALKALGEDPNDLGGYFIAKGHEYNIEPRENIKYNSEHIHIEVKPGENVRVEFLSQPGGAFENSSAIRVRYMTNGQITFEINSTKFEKVKLPFYIVYRLLGMTNDRDIVETVVFDADDRSPITMHILNILEKAMHSADTAFTPLIYELNREKLVQMTAERILKYLTNPTSYLNNESAIQFLVEDILGSPTKSAGLDKILLPHMGTTFDSRIRKLRFLGLIIHKMLLVHLGIMAPTDRDSYRNKRVHGSGVSFAKTFKQQVNNTVITPILKSLRRELRGTPWSSITNNNIIDTFRNSLASSDLNRAMEQAIVSGKNIVVGRRVAVNRVSSQAIERKNVLNVVSALRSIVAQSSSSSNSTERAMLMRRVHPSYIGFICVSQSAPSGENVGLKKQLAVTASICIAGEAYTLKLRLLADKEVISLDNLIQSELARKRLSRIFINGEWIGVCVNSHSLLTRYRALRREGRFVDPHTTIHWDPITDEINFWLDVGRLYRPLLIVDNNIDEYDASCRAARRGDSAPRVQFTQNIRFTKAHARGIIEKRVTMQDLLDEGIVEYITSEEQENCLIAESILDLRKNKHNITKQFTHCDIEQAIFGIPAHMSPYGNHTQPSRVTFESEQCRQTGGWYAFNWPFLCSKNKFLQWHNEIPLIYTLTQKFVPSNGMNVVVAYMSYGGDNQEDSVIVSQAAADRGLLAGAFFVNENADLEKGEMICNPDILTTKNIKRNACYEKLVDGVIRVGSIVTDGDVLIGRVAKINKTRIASGDDKYLTVDRSVVYRNQEPAIVEEVLRPRGVNDEISVVIKLRRERPLRIGDKLSSRSGNKCLTPDHEVLTKRGWVPIAEVTLSDYIFSINEAGIAQYDQPTHLHSYDINEPLFEVITDQVNLRTTLNHRMYVAVSETSPMQFIIASELTGKTVYYKKTARYAGYEEDLATLEALIGADGKSKLLENHVVFKTSSKDLADSVQILAVRVGLSANITCSSDDDLRITWYVNISQTSLAPAEGIITSTNYCGKVYCLTMPLETFYVRRDGVPMWTGNSIVANMLQQSDMPFTKDGIPIDLIFNPSCMPTRMTNGQLIETGMGKICARKGILTDGTAFLPVDHAKIAEEMIGCKFRYNGLETLFDGMTGKYMQAAIFVGIITEQRLQKFVLDEEQAVAKSGPTDATTGQPLGGKHIQGGLRIGEMENWVLEAHGSMRNLYEKYSIDSDGRVSTICRVCGNPAAYNEYYNIYQCRTCGEAADLCTVETTKAAEVLRETLFASGVRMQNGIKPRGFEVRAPAPAPK
jgi:DNA-directed RNA polymerase beta subunit